MTALARVSLQSRRCLGVPWRPRFSRHCLENRCLGPGEIERAHAGQIGPADPAATTTRQICGEVRDECLPVAGARRPVARTQPPRRHHHAVRHSREARSQVSPWLVRCASTSVFALARTVVEYSRREDRSGCTPLTDVVGAELPLLGTGRQGSFSCLPIPQILPATCAGRLTISVKDSHEYPCSSRFLLCRPGLYNATSPCLILVEPRKNVKSWQHGRAAVGGAVDAPLDGGAGLSPHSGNAFVAHELQIGPILRFL